MGDFDDVDAPVEEDGDRDAEAIKKENEKWKALKEEYEAPVKFVPLFLAEPVATKASKDVIPALHRMLLKLRGMGLPVHRAHADRGGCFRSAATRRFWRLREVSPTYTEGDAPQSNGLAELAVGQLKGKVRTLLRAAGTPTSWWPLALRTAVGAMWAASMEVLGQPTSWPLPFGETVTIRKRE